MRYSPDRPACHPSQVAADADPELISRSRLESISDGVIAVALTLLVLSVDAPKAAAGESLWDALDQGTVFSLLLFVLSFAIIARFWVVHHAALKALPDDIPSRLVVANFGFLLMVCLVPFATTLYARNNSDMTALVVYALAFALMSLLLSTIRTRGNLRSRPMSLFVPAVFLLAIPVGLIIGPNWATMTWLILVIVPDHRVNALLNRRAG